MYKLLFYAQQLKHKLLALLRLSPYNMPTFREVAAIHKTLNVDVEDYEAAKKWLMDNKLLDIIKYDTLIKLIAAYKKAN